MNNKQSEATIKMVNINKKGLSDQKLNVKFKLSALWTSMMMLFIYADIFSLHRPGYIDHMRSGLIGPFQVTQNSLFLFSVLMIIPALMIFLSLALSAKANRIVNIVWGVIYTLVCVGNLVGETWIYYITYGVLELFLCLMIIYYALKWPKQELLVE